MLSAVSYELSAFANTVPLQIKAKASLRKARTSVIVYNTDDDSSQLKFQRHIQLHAEVAAHVVYAHPSCGRIYSGVF
jgi:hypothetical protein